MEAVFNQIKMQSVTLNVIGDGGVGKTSLLIKYATDNYPVENVPQKYNYSGAVKVDGKYVNLYLWDIDGDLKPEDAQNCKAGAKDSFLICFSVTNQASFDNIVSKYIPQINHLCPGIPYFLVGLKQDMRNYEGEAPAELITAAQAISHARKVGARGYLECSASTGKGVKELFEASVKFLTAPMMKRKKSKTSLVKMLRFGIKSLTGNKKENPGEEKLQYCPFQSMKSPINGHSASIIGTKLYLTGGSDASGDFNRELIVFDTKNPTSKWYATEDLQLPPLQFHSCVSSENCLYIFGGKSNGYRNDCYRIDVEFNRLYRLETHGTPPGPRFAHTAVLHAKKMYVFGGYDNSASAGNDLYSFDIESCVWEKVKVHGIPPTPRFMHTAVVVDNTMYIFGGQGGGSALDDVHQFDFGICRCTLRVRVITSQIVESTWSKFKTKGKSPSPRFGHSAVGAHGGMYVFGGCDKTNDKYYSNAFFLDFSNKEWYTSTILPAVGNKTVDARYNHASVFDPATTSFYIIGGQSETTTLSSAFVLSWVKSLFDTLPQDILLRILNNLSLKEIGTFSRACKRLRDACDDETLWQRLCALNIFSFQDSQVTTSFKQHLCENYSSLINSVPTP